MLKKLRAGMMPPAGKPRPDLATVQALATSLETEIDAHAKPNLAMPRLHRLNRTEYQNAVRDVLGLDIDAAQMLPATMSAAVLTIRPARSRSRRRYWTPIYLRRDKSVAPHWERRPRQPRPTIVSPTTPRRTTTSRVCRSAPAAA